MPLVRARASSRLTFLLAVLALFAATLVPTSPASAADTGWDADNACPSGEVPSSGFTDLTPRSFAPAIDCLFWYQLTAGQTSTTYGTTNDLTRAQTASFVTRVMERVDGVTMPSRDRNAFPDVRTGPHVINIETLAGGDPPIVTGFADGFYRPSLAVTRAQFATIVTRMLDELADQDLIEPLPEANNPFTDTRGNFHEDNIARLANAGIVQGRTSTTFDPNADINRGQVALMVTRILGGLVDRELVLQPLELTGTIHDATDVRPDQLGPRIPGATVKVEGVGPETRTTTGSDGRYRIWVQQPGTSLLTVDHPDFVMREVPMNLPDANFDDGLDLGMYRPADFVPENADAPLTTTDVVRRSNDGYFWIVGLGPDRSAKDAEPIVLKYPNGIAIELGDAGTDDAWFSRNLDGTSNRVDQYSGVHTLYYKFEDGWERLEATFDNEGRLTDVNGTPYLGG